MNKHIYEAAKNPENTAIIDAFRFLDDIGAQIESLRKTLLNQLKDSSNLEKFKIKVDKFKKDYCYTESEWLIRTEIDTFEIMKKSQRSNAVIYGAFQITLYPSGGLDNSSEFIPYLAVLLCEAKNCEQWESEEFQLGNEFSPVSAKGVDGYWKKSDIPLKWKSTEVIATVFVVSLVELQNASHTQSKVIDRLFKEVEVMLKEIG